MAGRARSQAAIPIGLSYGVARHTALFHNTFAFSNGEFVRGAEDCSRMEFFSICDLFSCEVLRSRNGSPRRGTVSTPLKLVVFSGVALTAIQSRQVPCKCKSLVVEFFLALLGTMTLEAGYVLPCVFAHRVLMDYRGCFATMTLCALSRCSHIFWAWLPCLHFRSFTMNQKGDHNHGRGKNDRYENIPKGHTYPSSVWLAKSGMTEISLLSTIRPLKFLHGDPGPSVSRVFEAVPGQLQLRDRPGPVSVS